MKSSPAYECKHTRHDIILDIGLADCHGTSLRGQGIMKNQQSWIEQKLAEERRLYDLYAKHLEPEHNGEFVAISLHGKIIVGKRDGEVLKRAVETFGRGKFAMARVGHEVMHELVTVW